MSFQFINVVHGIPGVSDSINDTDQEKVLLQRLWIDSCWAKRSGKSEGKLDNKCYLLKNTLLENFL